MVDKHNCVYMGVEMTFDLSGDAENGVYVAAQWIRETTQGSPIEVPIDGVYTGSFRSMENAFDALFDRMRKAIDREVEAGRTASSRMQDRCVQHSFERFDLKLTLSGGAYVRHLRSERSLTGTRTMTRRNISRGALTVGVVAALAGAYGLGHRDADASQVIKTANVITPAESAARVGTPEFSDIVATYGPAVVNISAKHVASPGGSEDADGNKPSTESLGSGFIISQSGYILTNNHVVDGADVVTVKLKDRREFRAKVIGADKQSDVAVLKIDAGDLPTVRIGDPAKSKVGERVLAIGSPYGLDNTVTSGIISAKSRTLPGEGYTPFIQTDVPVNPGNSGGPLFNGKGEVIGINSMIYSRTGGFQGLSFAIPIDEAIKVKNDLVKNGYVSRGRLGVAVGPVDQSAAQSLGMKKPQGALVASVDPDGPAAAAGIQAGDVILSVNGTPVPDTGDLPAQIAGMSPGTTADIGIWRDAGERSLSVRLGVQPGATQQAGAAARPAHARLGVAVRPLSPQEQSDASLSSGLLVEQAQNAAANAGIEPGDVILAVDGEPVENVEQLRKMISEAGDSISLQIQRGGEQMSVPVKLG